MMCNADITIFNKWYDAENRQNLFVPSIIKGVSLYMKSGSSGDNKFRESSAAYKIRIPIDADTGGKVFLDMVAYSKLTADEVKMHWTIQPDAVVIPYAVEKEQTADLTKLTQEYGTFITVTDYSDNTNRGIQSMKHWRIGGV